MNFSNFKFTTNLAKDFQSLLFHYYPYSYHHLSITNTLNITFTSATTITIINFKPIAISTIILNNYFDFPLINITIVAISHPKSFITIFLKNHASKYSKYHPIN